MRLIQFSAAALLLLVFPAWAAPPAAPTAVHLLDYIGVDYAEAVADGEVINALEYAEMTEFADEVRRLLDELPPTPDHPRLVAETEALAADIQRMAPVAAVRNQAAALRDLLIVAYDLPTAPAEPPNLDRGAELYDTACASCHGISGHGDGPAGAGLDPAPSNFHDADRMAQRGVYGLFNTITLGVDGTGMASYAHLSADDRWALAYHVASYAAKPPLVLARDALARSVDAYRAGDRDTAIDLAVHAYLDGFELVEAAVQSIDAQLMRETEAALMEYRALVRAQAPIADVVAHAARTHALLDEAEERLKGGEVSNTTTFVGALLIFLREGLEAILVVAAILAILSRTGRTDARRWVHFGWIAALALGGVTWYVSAYVIQISGASREITEGATALIAAAMLLYVGYWLHSKSRSDAWQRFIDGRVGAALSGGTVWTLGIVSFLAVYREAFETVLFYQALATHAGPNGAGALLAGFALGVVLLLVVAAIIRWASIRLPIGMFFGVSGVLLMALAFVFAGQGVAALQEAGRIAVTPLPFFTGPSLGVYPTLQSLAAQAVVVVVASLLLWRNKNVVSQ